MPSLSSRPPSSSTSESSSSSHHDGHDFEPTSELKLQIKSKIEESMSSMFQDAGNIRAAQQKVSLGLSDPEQPTLEYKQTIARIRDLAEERYHLELKIARERNKLRLKLAQVMKPSLSRQSPPSTTPPSRSSDAAEFEPEDEWKEQLKKKIEGELQSMVQAAKDTQREELKRPISSSDRERLEFEYQKAMKNILTIADEQYVAELNRERNQRRWVVGAPMDPRWGRVLHEEQEDILASIRQPRHSKSQSPLGRFATEIISEDNQDDMPNGRYKHTPSPLSKGKHREVLREEEEPESRDESEEESTDDSDDSEELIEDGGAGTTRRERAGKFVQRQQPQPFQEDDFILLDARIIEEQERLLQQAQSRKHDEAFKLSHQQSHYRPGDVEQQAQFRQREEEIKRRRAEERRRSATISSDSGRWSNTPNPPSNPSTSPVNSILSNGVPKPTPQYNSASIWEKNLNHMASWRTGAQAARPSSTMPAQVPRPSSTKPVGGFAQSLPPARPWSVAPPHGRPRTLSATHQVVPFPAPVPIPTPGPGHSHHRSGSSGLSENMAKWARPSRQ